jgi:hypothetical protein
MERERCSELHRHRPIGFGFILRFAKPICWSENSRKRGPNEAPLPHPQVMWTWLGVHGNVPRIFNPRYSEIEILLREVDFLGTRTRECHDVLS